jgi:hypothetical protein
MKHSVEIPETIQKHWFAEFLVTYQWEQLALSYAEVTSTVTGTTQSSTTVSVSSAENATTDAGGAGLCRWTSLLCCNKHQRTQQEQSHQQLRHFRRNCADCDLKGEAERHSVDIRTRFRASPSTEDTKLGPLVCHQKCEDSKLFSCVNSGSASLNL